MSRTLARHKLQAAIEAAQCARSNIEGTLQLLESEMCAPEPELELVKAGLCTLAAGCSVIAEEIGTALELLGS